MEPKTRQATRDEIERFARNENAVSPVIAVILMVAITVVLAATVFVLVSDISGDQNKPGPVVAFSKDNAAKTLTVSTISENNLKWSDFTVQGCTKPTTGNVTAGNSLTGCSGNVKIVYAPRNTLVYETDF